LTFLHQCIQRLTQRTVKFIRWLKNHLDSERSWQRALASLAKIYARLRRTRKSGQGRAKLSYGGGVRERDRRSWIGDQG
jgi:hypothetical protein